MSQPAHLFTGPPRPHEHPVGTTAPASFVGKSGRFFVRQRCADGNGYGNRVTVWPSVTDYDQRTSVLPTFCDTAEALTDFSHVLSIYPESLTTTPPAYEPDRDETDRGLTPRTAWKERLTQTPLRHAA